MTAREVHVLLWVRYALYMLVAFLLIFAQSVSCFAQADPASEPSVLAVAKVLPAVVDIITESVVIGPLPDPIWGFFTQFLFFNRGRAPEGSPTLPRLGCWFLI